VVQSSSKESNYRLKVQVKRPNCSRSVWCTHCWSY